MRDLPLLVVAAWSKMGSKLIDILRTRGGSLWVNGSQVNAGLGQGLAPSPLWMWAWVVCPACLCVSRRPRRVGSDEQPSCPAHMEEGDVAAEMRVRKGMVCGQARWLGELAPRLEAAMEATLILHGIAAVALMIETKGPVDIGLDDPGGAPYVFDFSRLRPRSIKRKRKRRKK